MSEKLNRPYCYHTKNVSVDCSVFPILHGDANRWRWNVWSNYCVVHAHLSIFVFVLCWLEMSWLLISIVRLVFLKLGVASFCQKTADTSIITEAFSCLVTQPILAKLMSLSPSWLALYANGLTIILSILIGLFLLLRGVSESLELIHSFAKIVCWQFVQFWQIFFSSLSSILQNKPQRAMLSFECKWNHKNSLHIYWHIFLSISIKFSKCKLFLELKNCNFLHAAELFVNGEIVQRSPERQRRVEPQQSRAQDRPRYNDRTRYVRRRENVRWNKWLAGYVNKYGERRC